MIAAIKHIVDRARSFSKEEWLSFGAAVAAIFFVVVIL